MALTIIEVRLRRLRIFSGKPAQAAASPFRRHAAAAFSRLVVPGTG
jgi:hypothetical protein